MARVFADPVALQARREMLLEPRARILREWVEELRQRFPEVAIPHFDPMDGGPAARILFLLEKPGPKAVTSGFISRDNDDPTAEALKRFMGEAGLDRSETVLWNLIPGWNGTIEVTSDERRHGLAHLTDLLPVLPALHTVVLVGRKAGTARSSLEGSGLRILESAHPSGRVRALIPDQWRAIPAIWAEAGTPVR